AQVAPARADALDRLDAGDAAPFEEVEHGFDVVGRAVAEPHDAAFATVDALVAQSCRRHAVMRQEGGIEAAQAAEATGGGDFADWQAGIGEQLPGCVQPTRLQVLQRRDAEMDLEEAAQVPVAQAEPFGEAGYRGRPGPAVDLVEPARRARCEHRPGILDRLPIGQRGELGPATHAGPVAGLLALRRMPEEAAVHGFRYAHPAYRSTVDTGRLHRDEEVPVEARVVRLQGPIALDGVEFAARARGNGGWSVVGRHRRMLVP